MVSLKSNSQVLRFIIVGLINTVLDFGILFILTRLGVDVIIANIISSTTAFIFSFFANKKYTFRTAGTDIKREMVLFIIVTLTGLWGLQSLVIWLVKPVVGIFITNSTLVILGAKLVATCVSLVWNYVLYSRFVFIKKTDQL